MLMNKDILQGKFERGLSYADFVATGEPLGHRDPWDMRYEQLHLSAEQDQFVKAFTRQIHVLCLTGTWCGDCALQGSAMARIAEANPKIHLRFVPKSNEHAELVVKAVINNGFRVPVTWFMAEDFETVSWFGDRTLSRYRSMARKGLAPELVEHLAPPPADPVREVLSEVLEEFERVQLLLRLSTRLRSKHDD